MSDHTDHAAADTAAAAAAPPAPDAAPRHPSRARRRTAPPPPPRPRPATGPAAAPGDAAGGGPGGLRGRGPALRPADGGRVRGPVDDRRQRRGLRRDGRRRRHAAVRGQPVPPGRRPDRPRGWRTPPARGGTPTSTSPAGSCRSTSSRPAGTSRAHTTWQLLGRARRGRARVGAARRVPRHRLRPPREGRGARRGKTRELSRANRRLEEEVAQHSRTEAELPPRRAAPAVDRGARESEAVYHSLVETLPQNIFRKDLQGRYTFANANFARSLNHEHDGIAGKTDLDFFPPELAAQYRADDERVRASGRAFHTVEEHVTADGDHLYVEVIKTPVRAPTAKRSARRASSGT